MWMASENVNQQSQRNNLGMSFGDQLWTHSFGDTMQEEDNYPNTKMSHDSPELETTEIQDQPSVQGILSQFSTFAGYKITEGYPGERIKVGTRVVKRKYGPTPHTANAFRSADRIYLGTICNVSNNGTIVNVQWDNSDEKETFIGEKDQFDLLLFDNAQTGVKHTHSTCNACNKHPLSGIRWKCLNCDDIDLCTYCYMCDAHDVSHIFNRIESEDSKGEKVPPREDIQWTGFKYACGILENADVSLRKNNKMRGNVVRIHEYGRRPEEMSDQTSTNEVEEHKHDDLLLVTKDDIEVQWDTENRTPILRNILELKCEIAALHPCYPDHLPILENDTRGRFEVECSDGKIEKKISVDIWYKIKRKRRRSYKPVLYLIFENDVDDNKIKEKEGFAILEDVLELSKKTELPCHVVGQKVLFHHGSSTAVFIHHTTRKETIMALVRKGFLVFQRGDTDQKENEIDYFIRMAEYVLGEKMLPVMVSLNNCGLTKECNRSAVRSWIPILQFKKKSLDVNVLTTEYTECKRTEYKTNLKTPWNAKKSISKENTANVRSIENHEKISTINDVQSNFDFEALICYVVIGVAMVTEDEKYGKDTKLYANALSMYLLKKGKWRIPKECINELIDYRSVEYIYEEDCRLKLTNGLFTDLLDFSSSFHVLPLELGKGGRMTEDEIKPELYGLIFFALLKKEFYPGAKQLVETGFVRIHHLLVGCQLLQEVANDWKTTNLHKENLTRLKEAFTHRALQITRCIYETEKKKKDQSSNELVENELGEPVGHAGRLLLNHGYLEDAIKTANKTFLEKDTVSKILNKIWYGEEKTSKHQVWSIIMLASVHLLLMPLLMISMETGPLKWCYKKYKLPVLKVLTQMLGYFALLVLYAYMLLFNLNKELSYMDMFIAGWMGSFFLNEIKQAFVSTLRKRFKNYLKDSWNQLDWALMAVYAAAMILKFGNDQTYQDAAQILLVVTFILLSIRILHMFSMSEFLGPKLVIIHKMFKDTFIFMVILTVIMLSYNVSFHSLLYPNSELSWKEMEKMMQTGYWMLFGELNLDRDTLREPECTFNKTIYNSDTVPRCPTTLGLHVAPYLKALYGLIAVILLLNLLIAIYSDTFEKVQQESEFHWSQLCNGFLEEFSVKTIFPIHLQLLELPFCLVHSIIWWAGFCCKRKTSNKVHHGSINQRPKPADRETLNGKPMFVRVFLYNTNYDLKLQSTKDEEGIGTSKSKGTIEVMEEDTVTVLQKQMEIQNSKLEKQHDEILEELKNIKKYMVRPKKSKKKKKSHGERKKDV